MARAKQVERQPADGMTLIVLVGLAIAFLLYIAFLNGSRNGSLWSETNLLFATLIFYAGAGALYLGFGVTGAESCVKFASLATWLGLIANTAAVAHRWYDAGHPPFSNVYEMLLSFVWALAVLTLIAEKKYGVKVIGTITMPVAIVGVVLMQLLRTSVHPLIPLLQSTWLDVHVTLAILAYAACTLSFAFAMMFLIQDNVKTETFLAISSASTLAIYASIVLICFGRWGGLSLSAWSKDRKVEVFFFHHSGNGLADHCSLAGGCIAAGLLRPGALEEQLELSNAGQSQRIRQHSHARLDPGRAAAECSCRRLYC